MSKEAWVAVGGIGAAVVTGVVTLLVHVLPAGQNTPESAPEASVTVTTPPPATTSGPVASPTTTTATTTTASATGVAAMVGRWAGTAKDTAGGTFQLTLEITRACGIGEPCGSIGVSHVPCYGEVSLDSLHGEEVEFSVDNFDSRSDRSVCQAGAGERFRLRPDGKLAYRSTYEPVATAVLSRVAG
ncbi:hypothetical protein [Flindersiella endophytica]